MNKLRNQINVLKLQSSRKTLELLMGESNSVHMASQAFKKIRMLG